MDHDRCREKVCVVCVRKATRGLSERDIELIKAHARPEYEATDPLFPSGLCNGCYMLLRKKEKNPEVSLSVTPFVPDCTMKLRSMENCPCSICSVAKATCLFNQTRNMKKKRGRPMLSSSTSTPKSVIKICTLCLTEVYQGCRHQCSQQRHREKKLDNLQKLAGSPKSLETSLGHNYSEQKRKSTEDGGGPKRKLFLSLDDMCVIRKNMDLSTRQTRELAHYLRVATSRDAVESGVNQRLRNQNHELDDLFGHEMMLFVEEEKNKIKRKFREHAVVVKDVNELIRTVLEKRKIDKKDALIRVGLDGGGGFLKICLSAFDIKSSEPVKGNKMAKKFKDSGVKKVFILAITPGIQENYINMKKLWLEAGLHNLRYDYTIATDLKLCNILLGLMSHGSLHPCCWCDIDSNNLKKKGNQRTFASLLELYFAFLNANVDRSKAKNFGNVVHSSIIGNDAEQNTPIIRKVPPPELHLLIGPTQHLIDQLCKVWPECEDWLSSLHITRSEYFGGALEGNDCRKILKNINKLEERCPPEFTQFVKTFHSFNRVVESCYGFDLSPNYRECINDFTVEFLKLGISVTPKVHAVMHHVAEFCTFSGTGLGPYSEQTSEALHHEFKKCWKNYFVKNTDHPSYPEHLLDAVRAFNSMNI